MDELLFHLCTMSDSLHNTLPAKENLFEIQSHFSVPLSGHVYSSDSEVIVSLLHRIQIIQAVLSKHIFMQLMQVFCYMYTVLVTCLNNVSVLVMMSEAPAIKVKCYLKKKNYIKGIVHPK